MQYRDLVQFEPLDTIIQLRQAGQIEEARRFVRTYVFSAGLARQLTELVIPNLRPDQAVDAKGIFVVGNYGTGKSHLMSVLSSLAEHAELLADVDNPAVRTAAATIAGRYKVVRMELGAVTRRLRDSVVAQMEQFLAEMGTPYRFPALDARTNNKEPLLEAIAAFRSRHPDFGILFVVDELLDFLRSQEERALRQDLGFLRELGEVVELAPFRFIAGVQESLFDSPTFAFVASEFHRVRERFDQVRIERNDIAYVVAHRLLAKNDRQLAQVGEHLRRFVALYPQLGDRLGDYAQLFPIHPAYIETLEQLFIAEKRQVLQTFEAAIQRVLDQEVPTTETGLISYDHYWATLLNDRSLRAQAGVADVVDKSSVVAGRVESAYARKNLLPMARRIIDALSVRRLTTSDIDAPIGVTVEELRDSLCLWAPIPEADAQFLADTVQVAIKEIMRTVSGQYISYNQENGQYYLDLKKDIDFDANIARRGEFIGRTDLNPFFYDALRRLFTGLPASVYVSGYRIWSYELPWPNHNVTRPGYLFFGWPAERSTAQPPRDFYLYFLPPFKEQGEVATGSSATLEDEVTFDLVRLGNDFEGIMRAYAGARAMAVDAPAHAHVYDDKADEHLRALLRWLRANLAGTLRVSRRGMPYTVAEVLAGMRSTASQDVEEMVRLIAAHLLTPAFQGAYPEYPAFARQREPITETARPTAAMDAIRYVAAGGARNRTNLAIGVLDGLRLVDANEAIRTQDSPYAQHLLALLRQKEAQQVVNRGEVIAQVAGGLTPVFKESRFALEPEWVAVVLTALVYEGKVELSLAGNQLLDAATVERAGMTAIADLADFRFYRRPKGIPLAEWQQIFEAFGLPAALVVNEPLRADGIRQLQERVGREVAEVTAQVEQVQRGLALWNASLFTDRMAFAAQGGTVVGHSQVGRASLSQADLLPALRTTKEFLEKLGRFNTPGKLQNLALGAAEVAQALTARQSLGRARALLEAVTQLQPLTAYLAEAQAGLPDEDAWSQRAEALRGELLDALRGGQADGLPYAWRQRLEQCKREYVAIYAEAHGRYVLGPAGDERRVRLTQSPRYRQLRALAQIELFSRAEVDGWGEAATRIPTCREFHAALLESTPHCPHCRFRPVQAGSQPAEARLALLDSRLDALLAQWHAGLRDALQSATAQASIHAMAPAERAPLDAYLALAEPAAATLPADLVASVNRALHGMTTLAVQPAALAEALKQGGLPCTVEELEQRYRRYMQTLLRGHDAGSTRLTVE